MSLRAMRPSAVRGKTSTPSHSSRRPSSGCSACAVHSLSAKSSPQRSDRRWKRSVGQRAVGLPTTDADEGERGDDEAEGAHGPTQHSSARRARSWEYGGGCFVLICMTPVLAMLELDGPTDALLAAAEKLDGLLETPDGLVARIVAPTDAGVVLWQLWQSAEARSHHADDAAHDEALRASGLLDLVTGTHARAFEGAALQIFS